MDFDLHGLGSHTKAFSLSVPQGLTHSEAAMARHNLVCKSLSSFLSQQHALLLLPSLWVVGGALVDLADQVEEDLWEK